MTQYKAKKPNANGYIDFTSEENETWYGEIALRTTKKAQSFLGRLFWFSIELGLVQTTDGLRIYGGGILSSSAETIYALESDTPERLPFDPIKMLQTPYRYDEIQRCYFVIDHIQDLFQLKSDKIIQIVENMAQGTPNDDFVIC